MVQHKSAPPHTGPWAHSELSRDESEEWLIEDSLPLITNKFSWRLKDSLMRAKVIRLFRSTLREFDPNDDWHCWRYLGAGGYGAAAVFNKLDAAAKLVDEIVVKEMTCMNSHSGCQYVQGSNCYIANEALVHNGLCAHRSDSKCVDYFAGQVLTCFKI